MSARNRQRRGNRDLVGRDFARLPSDPGRSGRILPLLVVGILLAGLSLASLRIDILRLRYGLAEAVEEEQTLLDRQRELQARVRTLRDPSRLAGLAEARGFGPAETVIDLRPLETASRQRP